MKTRSARREKEEKYCFEIKNGVSPCSLVRHEALNIQVGENPTRVIGFSLGR
jgi:hypothetical protein